MKPLFAIDITQNKKNETVNGEEFIVARADTFSTEALEDRQENLQKTLEASRLPLWLQIVKLLCGGFGLIVAGCSVEPVLELGIEQVFANAPVLLIAGGVCLVAWAILQFYSRRREKSVLQEQNAEDQVEAIERNARAIYEELGVPVDAATVDVLMFHYKIRKGEPIPQTLGLQTVPFVNLEVKAYESDGCLCLADTEHRYAFPLSGIKGIRTVNKRIGIPSWNKEEDPRKGIYKPYRMTVSDAGDVYFKPYYVLEIEREGELYGLYFPCYERAVFERLSGKRAED